VIRRSKAERDELVAGLIADAKASRAGDAELPHVDADDLLIAFIGDERVAAAYRQILRWYS
jgi:hypothetical protein